MQKILITGSKGFVGTHLVGLLKKRADLEIVEFEGDLLNSLDLEKLRGESFGALIHLVGQFSGTFEDLVKVNVVCLNNLLSVVALTKVILASSGAVYGDSKIGGAEESDELKPNTLYGVTKKYAEELLNFYVTTKGFDATILRFPNIYGAGSTKGVVFNFYNDSKNKGVITIEGDGSQIRDFLHVQDACLAIEKALDSNVLGIFNISTGKTLSIKDLAEIFASKFGTRIEYKPTNQNNLAKMSLNPKKSRDVLHFEPTVLNISNAIETL